MQKLEDQGMQPPWLCTPNTLLYWNLSARQHHNHSVVSEDMTSLAVATRPVPPTSARRTPFFEHDFKKLGLIKAGVDLGAFNSDRPVDGPMVPNRPGCSRRCTRCVHHGRHSSEEREPGACRFVAALSIYRTAVLAISHGEPACQPL